MFTVKPLARKQTVKLTVKPLVRKVLTPAQDRASFIVMLCKNGVSYGSAVREFDSLAKGKKNAR